MDLSEFKRRVLPMEGTLLRSATRLLKDSNEASDMVQEVIIKMWLNRRKIQHYNNLETYGLRLLKNQCFDQLKSRRQRLNEEAEVTEPSHNNTPLAITEFRDQMQLMDQILASLPSIDRMIIELRSLEEKSISEIAEVMDLSDNNIRVRLSRIRKGIREEFDKQSDYGSKN